MKMKKLRRIFKLRSMARRRIDPEQLPLFQPASTSSGIRDRSPSIDSISTNSSSSSTQTRRPFRSYGSFLPNYFNLLRNSLRRSKSSQVRTVWKNKSKYIWMAMFSANEIQNHRVSWHMIKMEQAHAISHWSQFQLKAIKLFALELNLI